MSNGSHLEVIGVSSTGALTRALAACRCSHVMFFSRSLAPHDSQSNSLKTLQELLRTVHGGRARVLVIDNPRSRFVCPRGISMHSADGDLVSQTSRRLYLCCTHACHLRTGVVHYPCLCTPRHGKAATCFNELFRRTSTKSVSFHRHRRRRAYFLYTSSLTRLVCHVFSS